MLKRHNTYRNMPNIVRGNAPKIIDMLDIVRQKHSIA